jgi:hypothetical protein
VAQRSRFGEIRAPHPECLSEGYLQPLIESLKAALGAAVQKWHKVKTAGPSDMITLACAIGAIIILGYSVAVLTFLRRLPERQD